MILQANKDKKTIASSYPCSLVERNNNIENYSEYKRNVVNYYLPPNFRKEIISRLNELYREEGGYGEIKRMKIKFLTEVLATASPGADLKKDKEISGYFTSGLTEVLTPRKSDPRPQSEVRGLSEMGQNLDGTRCNRVKSVKPC